MKTIFYKRSTDENGDYWFNNQPYILWFSLENTLYEPSNVQRTTVEKGTNYIKNVTVVEVQDRFSDDGIVRRIALYISN